MRNSKKERLYVSELLEDPAFSYPAYYTLSKQMLQNEALLEAIKALHSYRFENYQKPHQHEDIFTSLESGYFVIFKEKYIVGYFGGKLMYLEPHGWKGMPLTKEAFSLENWLV